MTYLDALRFMKTAVGQKPETVPADKGTVFKVVNQGPAQKQDAMPRVFREQARLTSAPYTMQTNSLRQPQRAGLMEDRRLLRQNYKLTGDEK